MGEKGHAAATGYGGHAAATGKHSIAAAFGIYGRAKAGLDGWIVLAAWHYGDDGWELVTVRSAKVGGAEGLKPNVEYCLTNTGEFEEAG